MCARAPLLAQEEKRKIDQKRNIIILMVRHMLDNGCVAALKCPPRACLVAAGAWDRINSRGGMCVRGAHSFVESAERLQAESGVSLSKFDVADNVDLMHIISVRRAAIAPAARGAGSARERSSSAIDRAGGDALGRRTLRSSSSHASGRSPCSHGN